MLLTENISSTRGLVNGSPALLDSLSFEGGVVPDALKHAYESGGFHEVVLETRPLSVNVRVGGTDTDPIWWHGVKLPDLSEDIHSAVQGAQVVPLLEAYEMRDDKAAKLTSMMAAQHMVSPSVACKYHPYMLAFAMTDYKLQGRTLPKLIISAPDRGRVMRAMTMTAFYVLVSRVTSFAGLRLLQNDAAGRAKLKTLRHDNELYAWEHGWEPTTSCQCPPSSCLGHPSRWKDALAKQALAAACEKRAQGHADMRAQNKSKRAASAPASAPIRVRKEQTSARAAHPSKVQKTPTSAAAKVAPPQPGRTCTRCNGKATAADYDRARVQHTPQHNRHACATASMRPSSDLRGYGLCI